MRLPGLDILKRLRPTTNAGENQKDKLKYYCKQGGTLSIQGNTWKNVLAFFARHIAPLPLSPRITRPAPRTDDAMTKRTMLDRGSH
jgi:hypothetical protein